MGTVQHAYIPLLFALLSALLFLPSDPALASGDPRPAAPSTISRASGHDGGIALRDEAPPVGEAVSRSSRKRSALRIRHAVKALGVTASVVAVSLLLAWRRRRR